MSKPVRLSALKKICKRSHFQKVLKDNGIDGYCNKEETRIKGPWSYGTKPINGRPNKKKQQPTAKELMSYTKEQMLECTATELIRYDKAIKIAK